MSCLEDHARAELQAAGLLRRSSAYEGMVGECTLELVRVFARQGHSGGSAAMTVELFRRLASFAPLEPLTNRRSEWTLVRDAAGRVPAVYQSRRLHSAFSDDGLRTWYDIDERLSWWRRLLGRVLRRPLWRRRRLPDAQPEQVP